MRWSCSPQIVRSQSDERVECLGDDAFRGVLDRHDAEFGLAAFDRGKHVADRGGRHQLGGFPEMPARGEMAVGSLGTEKRDAQAMLERTRRGDDLAEHRFDGGARERTRVLAHQAGHDVALARRRVDRQIAALFHRTHCASQAGALVEQRQHGPIDPVDLGAQPRQLCGDVRFGGGRAGFAGLVHRGLCRALHRSRATLRESGRDAREGNSWSPEAKALHRRARETV